MDKKNHWVRTYLDVAVQIYDVFRFIVVQISEISLYIPEMCLPACLIDVF